MTGWTRRPQLTTTGEANPCSTPLRHSTPPSVSHRSAGAPSARSSSTWDAASTPASTSPATPPRTPTAYRGDVLSLTRELGVSTVRYPGGNFVSGYRWEDGVGPLDQRPRRRDLAWHTTEPNTVGLDEFIRWTRKADVEPMLAINLGTRGVEVPGRPQFKISVQLGLSNRRDPARGAAGRRHLHVPTDMKLAAIRAAVDIPLPTESTLWALEDVLLSHHSAATVPDERIAGGMSACTAEGEEHAGKTSTVITLSLNTDIGEGFGAWTIADENSFGPWARSAGGSLAPGSA